MRPRVLLAILLLIITLQLAACDRQSPSAPVDNAGPGVDLSDPDVGGGVGEDTGPQTPVPTATVTPENSPRLNATLAAVATFPPLATASSQPPTAEPATLAPTVEPPTPVPTAIPSATPEPSPTSPVEIIHVVQPGENLYRIGLIYGLSWVAIAEYNGIVDANAIIVGQELRIPPLPTPTPPAETTGNGPATGAVSEQPPAVAGQSPAVVTVSPGDTLYGLAQRHGVTWDQIAEANGLAAANQIYAGQVLKIPADAPGPTHDFAHQVHRDETLDGIARQYGLSPADLAAANGLAAPYVIYSGQTLVIPGER